MLLDFSNEVLKRIEGWDDKAELSLKDLPGKNNETKLCLCVRVKDVESFIPIVIMEPFYKEYQEGRELESIVHEIEYIISDIVGDILEMILKVMNFSK